MASGDDVQLPDLQVIQRYSLAVRGATAPLDDVIAVLRSDLDWLTGGRRRTPQPAPVADKPTPTANKVASKSAAPAKKAPAKKAPAKRTASVGRAPAKKAGTARKAPAKKAGARRA